MAPHTIKIIDKWIGQPICCLLTCWRYFWDISQLGKKVSPPKKILFIKLIEQGATVLAYSAIKRAVDRVGKNNVFFCVFKDNRSILEIINVIPKENIFVIRQNNFFIFFADVFRFFIAVRFNRIDSTVDMEFFSRASVLLAYLSGARNRAGLHRFTSEFPYRGDLLTHRLSYNPYLHTAKAYYLLVDALTRDLKETPMMKIPHKNIIPEVPRFVPDDFEMRTLLNTLPFSIGGEPKRPIILLNPNASDMLPLRKWPEVNFVELGVRLLHHYTEITIGVTGASSEKDAAEKIADQIKERISSEKTNSVINFAGKTSLTQLLVLYSVSDILVTNDSGPGHFSSMTDISTLILFGPETPHLFAPLGKNVHVIWKELACSPCVNAFNHRFSPCNDNVCMKTITVEEVFRKVVEIISAKA